MVAASVKAAQIVCSALTASTLTTIVVFFPIVFVSGIAGQVFGDMALTVIIALAVSLIAALFFIPMLISRRMPGTGAHPTQPNRLNPPSWNLKTLILELRGQINSWRPKTLFL